MIRYTRTEICIFLIVGMLSAVAYEQYYKFSFNCLYSAWKHGLLTKQCCDKADYSRIRKTD